MRLQLERDGVSRTYGASGEVDEAALLERAPDFDMAGNSVRLEGRRYRIALALDGVKGDLTLISAPGRAISPFAIRGANGWVTGYVVPALSGEVRGGFQTAGGPISLADATGYHDHNWGFWSDVHWQWGQVSHQDLSIVYGRVFPPPDAADPARVRGFLAVLGPDGPLGFSSDVSIDDRTTGSVDVAEESVDLHLALAVTDTCGQTRDDQDGRWPGMSFLQREARSA